MTLCSMSVEGASKVFIYHELDQDRCLALTDEHCAVDLMLVPDLYFGDRMHGCSWYAETSRYIEDDRRPERLAKGLGTTSKAVGVYRLTARLQRTNSIRMK